MNYRNSKGFVATDITIAIIIILLILPIITGMIYNIGKTYKSNIRKAEALNIAINTIECLSYIGNEKFESYNGYMDKFVFLKNIYDKYEGIDPYIALITIDGIQYKVTIIDEFDNLEEEPEVPEEEIENTKVVFKKKVRVEYFIGKNKESLELVTKIN